MGKRSIGVDVGMIEASVIISYIDSHDTLPTLLESLDRQDYPRGRFEVVLVNGDDFKPRVSEPGGDIIGVQRSKGGILFFTNSDRYAPPNWISGHMKNYPKWDVVGGNVLHHTTNSIQAINFGNISMKREVLEHIPINDIVSQHDYDFMLRFVKQDRFKATIGAPMIYEAPSAKWNAKHQFLMAQNIIVLRKKYRIAPPLSDFAQLRHPAVLAGAVVGLFKNKVVDAHV
jgi:cellulose synthase/poly-beta-1,6-N-acetylglucosamine synthase-like glycosyltransferase